MSRVILFDMKLLALNSRLLRCLGMISVQGIPMDTQSLTHSLTHEHAVQTQTKALLCTGRRQARQAAVMKPVGVVAGL